MTAIAIAPETATWKLDPTHSSVEFAVKHLMIATVKGSFSGIEATLGTEETGSKPTLNVTIDAGSISTHNQQRDNHLRSPDFFDVEKYPTISFAARQIDGDLDGEFKLIGDLTMHGVTREVALDATFEGAAKDPWGGSRIAYSATGKLRRSDFGLTWNQVLETGGVAVSDDIKIRIDTEFVRQ